jgi:membrane-associated phospholipid phosphatase
MRATALRLGLEIGDVLRRHSLLMALTAAVSAYAFAVSVYFEFRFTGGMVRSLLMHFITKVPQMVILVMLGRLLHLTYVKKVPDRMAAMRADIIAVLSPERMFSGFLAVVIMGAVLMSFAQMKMAIPLIQPFAWDETMMKLDRFLHFGFHPYEIVHAFLGWHYPLTFFSLLYNYWLFVTYFFLFGACFVRPDNISRMQYLLAFLFTWTFGGNLMATAFSSAGPPYYALLGLGDAYEPMMATLRAHFESGFVSEVDTQERLWNLLNRLNSVNAISAFPSMHVASSTLMAIYAFRITPWLGYLMTAFAIGIMIGSVLLGWHYAVDGYAGALIALGSWKLAGWLNTSRLGAFGPGVR